MEKMNWVMALLIVCATAGAGMALAEPRLGYRVAAWLHLWAEFTVLRRERLAAHLREMDEQER